MKKKELSSLKEGLMLQLDAAFALQLQEMFGSAGFYLLPGKEFSQMNTKFFAEGASRDLQNGWNIPLGILPVPIGCSHCSNWQQGGVL